jgi:acetylornithine aminotransferase
MENILISTGHKLIYKNFVKAFNCNIYDSDGNCFLDLESGVWCTNVGHCNPRLTEVISKQAAEMVHTGYCYINPILDKTAKRVLEISGISSGKCLFLSSGSEAVECSVKIIKSFSDKPYMLTMKNCYLSAYGISGEHLDSNWINIDWMNGEDASNIDFSKIAAFVFEPGSSQGLVRFPDKALIQEIVTKTRESGGYVITNEVTTGIGRAGKWFGFSHYDFVPDIVAMGKGLGGGYPVSCVAISDNVLKQLDLNKFHHSQSHQNDPLGVAVANEVIEIIESTNLISRANTIGDKVKRGVESIKDKYGIIKEIRQRGAMIAIEFEKRENIYTAEVVYEELLKRRIIVSLRIGHEVLRLDPALTIEDNQIDFFIESLNEIISLLPFGAPQKPGCVPSFQM